MEDTSIGALQGLMTQLIDADKHQQKVLLRGSPEPRSIIPAHKKKRVQELVLNHMPKGLVDEEGGREVHFYEKDPNGNLISTEEAHQKRKKKGGEVVPRDGASPKPPKQEHKLFFKNRGHVSEAKASSLDRLRATKGEPYRPPLPPDDEVKIARMISDAGSGTIFTLDFTAKCFINVKRNLVTTIAEETKWACGARVSEPLIKLIDDKAKLGDQGSEAIAALLAVYGTVTRINLANNGVGDAGMAALARVLAMEGSTIAKLNLSLNDIRPHGAWELTKALKANTALKVLNLCGNPIGSEGAKVLASAVSANGTLEKLTLRSCGVRDDGAKKLAGGMRRNASIQTLDLTHNGITAEGVPHLVDMLRENSTLTSLGLCDNPIVGAAPADLARAVEKHPSLSVFNLLKLEEIRGDLIDQLDLSFRHSGAVGAHLVAGAIKKSRRLRSVDFRGNSLDDTAVRVVMEAVALCKGVASVDLRDNPGQTVIPQEAVASGGEAVVAAMRKVMAGGEGALPKMRWVVLGRSEAGKTALVNAIVEGDAKVETGGPTVGVNVYPELPVVAGGVGVTICDTGGAGMYWGAGSAAHVTEGRTLYLLVFDLSFSHPGFAKKEFSRGKQWGEVDEWVWLARWVRVLLVHSPSAVVAVVGTKADLVDPAVAAARLGAAEELVRQVAAGHRAQIEDRVEEIGDELKELRKVDVTVALENLEREAAEAAKPPWEAAGERSAADTTAESLATRLAERGRLALREELATLEGHLGRQRIDIARSFATSSADLP